MTDSGSASLFRAPRVSEIQQAVAERFGTRLIDMVSHRRARSVARPRQVAMYLTRELTVLSLPAIGRHFGGRDHTTCMHACRRIEQLAAEFPDVAAAIADVRALLLDDPNQLVLPLAAE
jgi:chromosomal replication initiator protein